jgi:DNA-binding transcriptional regulator YhcF (GntR family)
VSLLNKVNEWAGISFNSREPVYSQVVRLFKEKIVTGVIQSGQTIPSRRELAALLKINPNTAQRAYKEMEDQRLIVTEGNSPSRITLELDVLRQIRSELLGTAVEAFVASIHNIDVPLDELLDVVQQKYIEALAKNSQKPLGDSFDSGRGGKHSD